MTLRVYNTLSKQKELFEPVIPGKVGMYLCGPTVYKSPHIGHMVGPVIFDAVKRYLLFKGYSINWIVNITDVDDKLIAAATKQNTSMKELAERHTAEYFDCLKSLGIDTIDQFPKASDHIPEIIAVCQKLIDTSHAYAADGNVWFDVASDDDYGKLSNRRLEDQAAGNRTLEGSGKRNPADFALWKAAKPGEPAWDSPWGSGRPGWHIECSAMSMKYLGPTFDIHGGGMDLMFPHHENELAQSESATGKPFAQFWMHNGLTKVRTKAASGQWQTDDIHESSGNAASVRAADLISKNGPELLRYLLLSTHYRRPIEFTDDALVAAKKGLATFARLFERIERISSSPLADGTPDVESVAGALLDGEHGPLLRDVLNRKIKFLEMMDDDFNTAGAIAVLHEMASAINSTIEKLGLESREKRPEDAVKSVTAATATLRKLGLVLGLFRAPPAAAHTPAPGSGGAARPDAGLTEKLMSLLISLRQKARESKNFSLADDIRTGLTAAGVTLEDRADGTVWRKSE
jgi:cysteinyl-tRNA synthetase